MDVMRMMAIGAMQLVTLGKEHTAQHAAAGFSAEEWNLLTQETPWSQEQRRQVRSVLAEAVNVTLELAGLPSEPLPGQYVAAVIVKVVAPCNRLVAAYRAPETYDAVSASGLVGPTDIVEMTASQMVSLVTAYSSGVLTDIKPGWNPEFAAEGEESDKAA